MARKVFFSFHFENDCWRTQQVRNIKAIEGSKPVVANDWETIKKQGSSSVENWINAQLNGTSCTVVLIGRETANREWVKYEIKESWNRNKGLLGIRIHGLKDHYGNTASYGSNPFDSFEIGSNKLSTIVKCYDPIGYSSQDKYNYIVDNIVFWIEEAISIRSS